MNNYEQYVSIYMDLINSDDGSDRSCRLIEDWLNHGAYNEFGQIATDYYQQMMIQHFGHTSEDFED